MKELVSRNTGKRAIILWSDVGGSLVEFGPADRGYYQAYEVSAYFREYVEPKVIARERYIIIDGDSMHLASNYSYGSVGKIRVTHTEGKGLTVEVLEGEIP